MSGVAEYNAQQDQLYLKYTGTGHADMTKHEWMEQQKRDSAASYIAHGATMTYFATSLNESEARVRLRFLDSMIQPCGPPPQ